MIYIQSVPSTNTMLKELAKCGKIDSGYSAYTFCQTEGKGRNNREFESKDGGLYYSVALKAENGNDFTALMPFVSLIVCKVIEDYFGLEIGIKWVNDIIYKQKKCAGILCEKAGKFIIIGIGINIYNSFSAALQDKAIALLSGKEIDYTLLHNLAANLDKAIKAKWKDYSLTPWIKEYERKSVLIEKKCRLCVPDGKEIAHGIVKGFGQNGEIIIESEGKTETFNCGEISVFAY